MAKRKVNAAEVTTLGRSALKEFRAGVREALATKSSAGRSAHVLKDGRIKSVAASALVSRNGNSSKLKAKTKS